MRNEVIEFCRVHALSFRDLTPYQARLQKRKNKIAYIVCDIYWTNRRFHIIKHTAPEMVQQRGDIKDIQIFLESVFSNQ